jgi:CBS domain-containing protein
MEMRVCARLQPRSFHYQARHRRALPKKESEKMQCSEIMTKNPECCLPSDTVITAAQLMKSEDVGPIPIVADKDGRKPIATWQLK